MHVIGKKAHGESYTGCFMTWEHYCRRWFPRS